MLENLKKHLDETLDKLDDIDDYFEDRAEALGEDMKTAWKKTRVQLGHFGKQLKEASAALESEKDHIALQAHLATMDAHDQWTTLKGSVENTVNHLKRDGQTQLDEAALQAHLAAMDGRDFVNSKGKDIHQQYDHAREQLEQSTLKAASEIKETFDGLIGGLPK
ncbi:MAG: hypothetical protein CL693_10755 [Cellvibrionaceae bacterium]|nr:hypothetical protein [Cellvibrionaceae bacterium]|tara:strand:+ start:13610 stop:14101 length:492 start_codon:yes stop_codon:yes gene_type:complete